MTRKAASVPVLGANAYDEHRTSAPIGSGKEPKETVMASTFESMLSASRERERELRLIHILIDKIEPDPDQPRKHVAAEQLSELAASLRQDGVLHPILVQPADERGLYRIIAGERRWRAAREAGLKRLPAFIVTRDDIGRRRVQLVENLQRVDLTASERAQHVALMRELLALQAQGDGRQPSERELDTLVGAMLGISDRAVRDFLGAVALPAAVQDVAREHELSIKHLRAASLVGEEHAEPFMSAVAAAHITGDEALIAARLVRDDRLSVVQAVQEVRPAIPAPEPLTGRGQPEGVAGSSPGPLRPQATTPPMSRHRRTVYVRLLEVNRLLARLPLLEATDPAEAHLWIKALDGLIGAATTLRGTLAALAARAEKERPTND